MRCLSSFTESMNMNLSKLQEIVKGRKAWCAAVRGGAELDMTSQQQQRCVMRQAASHLANRSSKNLWKMEDLVAERGRTRSHQQKNELFQARSPSFVGLAGVLSGGLHH